MDNKNSNFGQLQTVYFSLFIVSYLILYFITQQFELNFLGPYAIPIKVVVTAFFSLLLMGYLSPLIMQKICNTRPVSSKTWRDLIYRIFDDAKIRRPNIHVVNLNEHHNVIISGFYSPIGIFNRTLFITPNLIDKLREEEIEAIIKHEVGHIQLHHLFKRLLSSLIMTILTLALCLLVTIIGMLYLPPQLIIVGSILCFMVLFRVEMKLLSFVVHHQELEADTNAVHNLKSEISDYCRTLYRLASISGIDASYVHPLAATNPSFAHPSIAQRVLGIKNNIELLRRTNISVSSILPYNIFLKIKPTLPIHAIGISLLALFSINLYITKISPVKELFLAVEKNDTDKISQLINRGISIDSKNIMALGLTVLNKAIMDKNRAAFDLALSYQASINTPSGIFKLTPALTALYIDDPYYVDKIYPILLNTSDFKQNEYLELANKIGKTNIINFLKEKVENNRSVASE